MPDVGSPPTIQVESLGVRFGAKQVLDSVDFDVFEGEILAVMGASGGGKTTLLRCIGGLIKPTAGSVSVMGIDVAAQPEDARKRLGIVFQSAALFDSLTIEQNVGFGVSRSERLSRNDLNAVVEESLAAVGLQGSRKLFPNELSGGMKKRAGLARALAMKPSIVLYDEPTSGLDPVTAYTIDRLIVDTRDQLGVTSVVVSHDVNSVLRVADKVAFLAEGRLVFCGPPDEFRVSHEDAIEELLRAAAADSLLEKSQGNV